MTDNIVSQNISRNINDLPLVNPDRPPRRIRPLKAYRHFRNLIADKEDTAEVFHIIEALSGNSFIKNAQRFVDSPGSEDIMRRNVDLVAMLDDHDTLRRLPSNSLGQAYVRFMEKEGLSAAGLVAEYEKFGDGYNKQNDITEWLGNRGRDTHDLLHILTGYGRDALGEQCVLAFTYGQDPNLGIIFIAYAAALEQRKNSPSGTPVLRAVREAHKLGKKAKTLTHYDIEKLLAMPLEEARAFLNVGKPVLYGQAHEAYRSAGIDPYTMLGQAA